MVQEALLEISAINMLALFGRHWKLYSYCHISTSTALRHLHSAHSTASIAPQLVTAKIKDKRMPTEKVRQRPHPLLTEPTLYAVDVPEQVKWDHLKSCFSSCGDVRSGRRSVTETGRRRWMIHFTNLSDAEMALATLQGVPVPKVNPPWVLTLSHSASLASALPKDPLCAQFVKAGDTGGIHGLHLASAQQIFRWFRVAGPLVSVRTNADVGYKHRTCVIEYWDEKDADLARRYCHNYHFTLRNMEPFSLRTFAPHSVLGINMGQKFKSADLKKTFGKFGDVIYSRVVRQGSTDCHCHISFSTREAAAAAVAELNNTVLNGNTIIVRYLEPKKQSDFRLVETADVRKPPISNEDPPLKSTQGSTEAKARAKDSQDDREKEARERKAREEEAKRRQVEAQARADYERKLNEAIQERDAAVAAETIARVSTLESIAHEDEAKAAHANDTIERKHATAELSHVSAAVLEAERALQAIKARQQDALNRVSKASIAELESDKALREATARRVNAEMTEVRLQTAREAAERREKEIRDAAPPVDEAMRRQEELEEMIRRMKELREQDEKDRKEQEERDRKEKEQKEQREREEQDRKERERKEQREKEEAERKRQEAERLVKEERERLEREEQERKAHEEQERIERDTRRVREYRDAALKEEARCAMRDIKWCQVAWTDARHVNWFNAVSTEFEKIKFSASQPLTFRSIPWPLLTPPDKCAFDLVEWSNVEAFFVAAKQTVGEKEYKTMVEKAHRRFHPDKWRSRGLLNTVLDDDLRERLEKAGNVVAQAITPLWLASKSAL